MNKYQYQCFGPISNIRGISNNDERFGTFLVPFLAGAVVSAPFWYLGANNKYNQQVYYQQPYPMYYPYQGEKTIAPSYYPYPPYR